MTWRSPISFTSGGAGVITGASEIAWSSSMVVGASKGNLPLTHK